MQSLSSVRLRTLYVFLSFTLGFCRFQFRHYLIVVVRLAVCRQSHLQCIVTTVYRLLCASKCFSMYVMFVCSRVHICNSLTSFVTNSLSFTHSRSPVEPFTYQHSHSDRFSPSSQLHNEDVKKIKTAKRLDDFCVAENILWKSNEFVFVSTCIHYSLFHYIDGKSNSWWISFVRGSCVRTHTYTYIWVDRVTTHKYIIEKCEMILNIHRALEECDSDTMTTINDFISPSANSQPMILSLCVCARADLQLVARYAAVCVCYSE